MAIIKQRLVIDADPNRPVQEVDAIILGMLQLWPGSEMDLLKAIRENIDQAIAKYEKGESDHANNVSGNRQ